MIRQLTIITIGYKNNKDLSLTMNSINKVLGKSISSIVKDGGGTFNQKECPNSLLISCQDTGIFDAINQGIDCVNSKYFMLVHSGDQLLLCTEEIECILKKMDENYLDLCLGSQYISFGEYNRFHGVGFWRKWHLLFGSQPPHLPTIYRTEFAKQIRYNEKNEVIGDYEYFEKLFKLNPRYMKYLDKVVIKMGPGGKTTNGLNSFFIVSREHLKQSGIFLGSLKVVFRLPLKLLSLFY